MTTKELSNLGICKTSNPKIFFVPLVGEVELKDDYTINDIFKLIYDSGYKNGIYKGKSQKMEEIRKCLGISDSNFILYD